MSRIPIKYELVTIKLSNGRYTSTFNASISYRVLGAGTWTSPASLQNLLVNPDGRIHSSNKAIITGLLEKTEYEVRVVTNISGSADYIESFKTHDNITVGDSPIYFKQIYRGQQFTWYFNPPPNGTDPNLDTDPNLNLDFTGSQGDWYYPFLSTMGELNQNWESFVLADENAPGPVFINKFNTANVNIASSGKYFNGFNTVEHDRSANAEPAWLSAGEMFNDFGGTTSGKFIAFNFFIEPVNNNVYMLWIGQTNESANFTVKYDPINNNIIINNQGTTFTITDTLSGTGVETEKWYTLRLSFRSAPSTTTATPGQRTVDGVYAYLYSVDNTSELGVCVGKASNPSMSLTWANAVVEVGDVGNEGYISEPINLGALDKSTNGLVISRLYSGTELPNNVLDTVGSLASTAADTIITSSPQIQRTYVNMLKVINFHKSVANLMFTKSTSEGGVTPFAVNSFLKLGDNGFTGSFPKVNLTQAAHINISLAYTVATTYADQSALNSEAMLRVSYARYRYAEDTTPSSPNITLTKPIAIGGETTEFAIDCGVFGNTGFACRAHVELILLNGALTSDLTINFGSIIFAPTNTVGGSPLSSSIVPFSTHLGSTNGSLIVSGNGAGGRNEELAALNVTAGGVAQINLNSMTSAITVTKHKVPQEWIGSVKAGSFTCTIPPGPNKYEAFLDDPNTFTADAVPAIVTLESQTIPKGTFQMGIESDGLTTSEDTSIVVGFSSFTHPTTSEVEVLDPEDWCHDNFDIDFTNAANYEAEKDKFFNLIGSIHTQWGGYNGGVNSDNLYFDETDKSLIVECHGDNYPLDGDVVGLQKGSKDYNFTGYGDPAPLPNSGTSPDPNYALSADKIKRRRVGAVLLTNKYCEYGKFLIRMKLPKGLIGVSPALWFFHYMEIYPTDPRWNWWIRKGVNTYSTNYLVVNNEIDMELPSHTTMYHFSQISEVGVGYWDALGLDTETRIGVIADPNPANNGTWKLKSGTWLDAVENIQTNVSNPYLPASWEQESKYLQSRLNPDMSNVKFNNWIGEKSGGFGWSGTKEDYTGRTSTGDIPVDGSGAPIYGGEEFLAKLTELSKNYADGEYHDWDIHWYPNRTELWVDGVKVRENKAFVPFNVMKYTFGLWFPSNKQAKLESGELSWETDRGSWGGKVANYEVAQMRISRMRYEKFTATDIANANGGDPNKLRYFSESYPEAGVRTLSKL